MFQQYGEKTNRLLSIQDMIKTVSAFDQRRHDLVIPRSKMTANAVKDKFAFSFEGVEDVFEPTNVALSQVSEKAGIPLSFLRQNVDKYPGLAARMVNTWMKDEDVINSVGTKRERKTKIKADGIKHLVRLFAANGTPGVFRAMLSSKYLVIDDVDALAVMLDEVTKAKKEDKIKVDGSLSDTHMNVRMRVMDISTEINFPGKGVGHEHIRVPCGASLLIQNSPVGMGGFNLIPELEVYTCTNLLRATVSMRQIHIGHDLPEMSFLSKDTVVKMHDAVMSRARDIMRTTLIQETFEKLAELFSEHAGETVENPASTIENVTRRFSLPQETHESIFSKFMEEAAQVGGGNRFALSQALTFQGKQMREADFEGALAFEEAGSKILTMTKDEFGKFSVADK
jgi:hypothetical protein